MIIYKLLEGFVFLVGTLVEGGLQFIGVPPDAVFQIPTPFFAIFSDFINTIGLSLPALTVFYVWRQAKS